MIITLDAHGSIPIETIIDRFRSLGMKATLHWTDEKRRVLVPVDGDFIEAEIARVIRTFSDAFVMYFDPNAREHEPLPDCQTREIEGKMCTEGLIRSLWKGPDPEAEVEIDVPLGIDLMCPAGQIVEMGDVRACKPAGFVAKYLAGACQGLERLAGVIGQVVVRQNDGFWVRAHSGAWSASALTQGAAIGKIKTEWCDLLRARGVRFKSMDVDALFRQSLLPVIDGTLTSPVESDFVEYQGRTYLNLRLAPRLQPTSFGEDGRLVREFFLQNLLNDHRPMDEIEADIGDTGSRSPTRWALHWVAHTYQKPGIALPTCLWLVSVAQGIGKTVFASMLAELVGRRNASVANDAEMTGEWSNWIVGKSLIVADEINVTEKKRFYSQQKTWIGSRSVSVRGRHVGVWEIPTIANWLYLTNDLSPIRIDGADRRNMMIASTNDKARALALIDRLEPVLRDPARYRSALAEFGAWLDTIQVDAGLLREAVNTELKDDVIASAQDAVVSFFQQQTENRLWRPGAFLSTAELFSRYAAWCEQTQVFQGCRSQTYMVNGLKRLRALGNVTDKRTESARGWVLVQQGKAEAQDIIEVSDFLRAPVVPMSRAKTMLEQMRERQRGARGGNGNDARPNELPRTA
ncbi:MAG: hypothetical protein KIS73_07975 [Enhydrobacter sp.]|nr:hypothetical protein [Enhydrobacter sp.]